MKKKFRPWVYLVAGVVILVFAGLLGGCGSTEPGSGQAASEPAVAATVAGVPIKSSAELNAKLPEAIRSAQRIRVASAVPFAPWEMFANEDQTEFNGIDIDLIRALAARLGVEAEIKNIAFDGIIPGMKADQYDVTISSMFDTAEREQVLDFVNYAMDGALIMVQKGNPEGVQSWKDLSGMTVVVQQGSVQEDQAKGFAKRIEELGLPEMKILVLSGEAACQLALKTGRAQAHLVDGPSGEYVSRTTQGGEAFEMVYDAEYPNGYDPGPIGIGVRKDLDGLADALASALNEFIADGTYAKILDQYSAKSVAVDEARINVATDAE